MSKELEYIEDKIKDLEFKIANPTEYNLTPEIKVKINDGAVYKEELATLKIINQALLELQAIKNANPSEALKRISIRCHSKVVWDDPIDFDLDTIKATLLKAEKLEKALEILKKSLRFNFYSKTREVEVYDLEDEEDYCFLTNKDDGSSLLTQQEFDLLKEMLG